MPPSQFLNTKGIVYRDHILMIDQFESMYNTRDKQKKLKEQQNKQQFQDFVPFASTMGAKNNNVVSVL